MSSNTGDRTSKSGPTIIGLCNPLLDVTAYVDEEILDKYNLKANNVILAGDEHKDLCKDLVDKYQVEYTAGGSSQNTMRVAAGILRRQNVPSRVLFTGCISNDQFGSVMSKKAKEDGVEVNYAITDSAPTGTCAVCLTEGGKNRSLCAFLGASQKFSDQHLLDNWEQLVENTDIIYISGFLITVSPATFHLLGEHVAKSGDNKKRFCMNLSAPYVSQVYGKELEKVIKYVDILFGNDDEALAYSKMRGWNTEDIDEIVTKISQEDKVRQEIGRLVIITRGGKPVVVAEQSNGSKDKVILRHFPCEPIPDGEMVDTNGAGDSFTGGFLSQYVQNAPLEFCIKMADFAAREIIKVSGITMPNFANLPKLSNDNKQS